MFLRGTWVTREWHSFGRRPAYALAAAKGFGLTNGPRDDAPGPPGSMARVPVGAGSTRQARLRRFIGPHPERLERIGAEGRADGDVGGIAAACDQDAPDARLVVARIEGVPGAAEIGFEPAGEVHGRIGRRHADVAQVAGAVPRRNVHAAAQGNGQVGVVPADPFLL